MAEQACFHRRVMNNVVEITGCFGDRRKMARNIKRASARIAERQNSGQRRRGVISNAAQRHAPHQQYPRENRLACMTALAWLAATSLYGSRMDAPRSLNNAAWRRTNVYGTSMVGRNMADNKYQLSPNRGGGSDADRTNNGAKRANIILQQVT
jgi:hypothetical protein